MDKFYHIDDVSTVNVKRFRTVAKSITVQFVKKTEFLLKIYWQALDGCRHFTFKPWQTILLLFTPIEFMSADKIMDIIEQIQQSNNEFQLYINMQIKFIIVEPFKNA